MSTKWFLKCPARDFREALRNKGFGVPDCYAECVSTALGGRYSAAQVLAEGDAFVEQAISAQGAEASQIDYLPPGPIEIEFRELGDAARDKLLEAVSRQKRLEARQIETGPDSIFDKKQLKAFCRSTAKRHGYTLLPRSSDSFVVAQKSGKKNSDLIACMTLDAGGRYIHYWQTTAVNFFIRENQGAWLSAYGVIGGAWGLHYYNRALPSRRELATVPADPGPATGVKQLNAYYARHPRTPDEISTELKVGIEAQFAYADLLLEHLVFRP